MFWYRVCIALVISLFPALISSSPVPRALTTTVMRRVQANAVNISSHSWEKGTLAEALTEFEWPTLTPFLPGALFPPSPLPSWESAADVLAIAETTIDQKSNGTLPLTDGEGSVGDPASLGQAVLLRNWTRTNLTDTRFSSAAGEQLGYIINDAPRAASGAISHRSTEVQLWSDFVYMAPPFIAYFGALQSDSALVQVAYDQIRLYRDALFDSNVSLWRHIALGSSQDSGHWATGNGWAAAGMMRVLATMNRSSLSSQMQSQQDNLTQWVDEILTGVWGYQQANGTLLNYVDQPGSFADSSSTALLAATTFRYGMITGDGKHDAAAIRALDLVTDSLDDDEWLLNTVNPYSYPERSQAGAHSPEGQSFVLLLAAAWSMY